MATPPRSNDLPTDPTLAAFADRFLVRVFVEPVGDPFLDDLLAAGWESSRPPTPHDSGPWAIRSSGGILDVAAAHVQMVDLSRARPLLAQAVRLLRRHGIELSDRRIVRSQRLVAAAVLDGRLEATAADLWPLVRVIPTAPDQLRGEEILHDILADAANRVAVVAAEDASHGPAARAARVVDAARAIFSEPAGDARRLRLEGVAREIDAGFDPATLPPGLKDLRSRIADELR